MTFFLTLSLGTSSAWNENLRSLLNTHIPLISGIYGIRNHFWPLESRFLMRKNEKKSIFSKPSQLPILISRNLILYTFLCTKIKKFTIVPFFLLMHVLVPCDTDFAFAQIWIGCLRKYRIFAAKLNHHEMFFMLVLPGENQQICQSS